jgi:hypothetical protein
MTTKKLRTSRPESVFASRNKLLRCIARRNREATLTHLHWFIRYARFRYAKDQILNIGI